MTTPRRFWTDEEDALVRAGFHTLTLADLCERLGRNPSAIGQRAHLLGCTRPARHCDLHHALFTPAITRESGS